MDGAEHHRLLFMIHNSSGYLLHCTLITVNHEQFNYNATYILSKLYPQMKHCTELALCAVNKSENEASPVPIPCA